MVESFLSLPRAQVPLPLVPASKPVQLRAILSLESSTVLNASAATHSSTEQFWLPILTATCHAVATHRKCVEQAIECQSIPLRKISPSYLSQLSSKPDYQPIGRTKAVSLSNRVEESSDTLSTTLSILLSPVVSLRVQLTDTQLEVYNTANSASVETIGIARMLALPTFPSQLARCLALVTRIIFVVVPTHSVTIPPPTYQTGTKEPVIRQDPMTS